MQEIISYLASMDILEAIGLVFGLLTVLFLIKENIWTWPTGIIYVLASLIIFWKENLYADFALHIFFLTLNIYGWWYWINGKQNDEEELPITLTNKKILVIIVILSCAGIVVLGYLLMNFTDASLPYWDSATTMLSLAGMWLTTRKKIENWYFWFVVDVLATGVYFYKGIYFYTILYLVYIILAVSGYLEWKKTMRTQQA